MDYTLTQKQQQLQQLQQQLHQQNRQNNNLHQLLIHQSQYHYKNLVKLSLMSQIIDKQNQFINLMCQLKNLST